MALYFCHDQKYLLSTIESQYLGFYYMPINKKILLYLIVLVAPIATVAQHLSFRHFSIADGLSHTYVNELYQDQTGFIWIGTYTGLNCYNGLNIVNFKHFENTFNKTNSVYVRSICGNDKDRIFIAYEEVLAEYRVDENKFSILMELNKIRTLFYREKLYVGYGNNILTYDERTTEKELLYTFPTHIEIHKLFSDSKNRIWIGTDHGLYRWDPGTTGPKRILETGTFSSLYEDTKGNIWIGSWQQGLFLYRNDEVKQFVHAFGNPNSLSSNFVRCIQEDDTGNFWVGTYNGLNKLDAESERIERIYESGQPEGLSNSSIWCMLKDHQGTLWMGTYFGGINYFNPAHEVFTHYRPAAEESEGLSSNVVGRTVIDKRNNLWICTEGGGLNRYDPKTGKYKWYKADPSHANKVSSDGVKSIYYDEQDDLLWIGTHMGGLNRLDLKTDRFTYFRSSEEADAVLPHDNILDIIPYKDNLLLATHKGISVFSKKTGASNQLFNRFQKEMPRQMVTDLFLDKDTVLWFAVPGVGVYAYFFDTNTLNLFQYSPYKKNTICSNHINNIYQDSEGYIWFSSAESGLDRYNPGTGEVTNYNASISSLMDDCVYGVAESPLTHELYIATRAGLMRFSKAKNEFRDCHIPQKVVNENALYIDRHATIYIGGLNGLVSFAEKDLVNDTATYHIIPVELKVDNQTIAAGDGTGILQQPLADASRIAFRCNLSFSISYATDDYLSPVHDNIVYKLEGFSDEWSQADGHNVISYTNLSPGTYTLIIKGQAGDRTTLAARQLEIRILPPFYRTTSAYLLYGALLGTLLYFGIKYYKNRVRLVESLKYEKKRNKDVEELNRLKLDFFTNISHELRTPLTIINGQVEMMLKRKELTLKNESNVRSIQQVGNQMHQLLNDLLDFRKQENKMLKLHVRKYNVVDFIHEIQLLYAEYAVSRGIDFTLSPGTADIDLWFDAKQLQKVINNVLSNAFKHTPDGGVISMGIHDTGSGVVLDIEDNGKGIDAEDINSIFDNFYQAQDASSGTGIGLALVKNIIELHHGHIAVESEPGMGAKFTITLPKGNSHFHESEIDTAGEQPDALSAVVLPEEIDYRKAAFIPYDTTVLIVEDNDALRKMLEDIFAPIYVVLSASNGEKGLELAMKEKPDIIISDVLMPKLSGIDLCRAIKDNFDTCHIPVILLTARSADEHTVEGLHSGADDYIIKPFNVNILVNKCNGLINNRISLKEKFSKEPRSDARILATNKLDKDFIDKVTAVIDANIANVDFNIDDFVPEIGIARTNIYSKIKVITGLTPNKLILTIRLKKASELLVSRPELTTSEIAYMVGFSSLKYFSKCFKDTYHIIPSAFRAEHTA